MSPRRPRRGAATPRRYLAIGFVCAFAASAAHAQYGGGGRAGGGHGGRGARTPSPATATAPTPPPAPAGLKPVDTIQIVGVIQAIDPASDRLTIAYEPVDGLHWPAGTNSFVVSKTALLKTASVGEKVRFTLDSQQISSLAPY